MKIILFLFFTSTLLTNSIYANANGFTDGHVKYLYSISHFSDDSLLANFENSPISDHNGNLRLKFNGEYNNLHFISDYQLDIQQGDSIELVNNLPIQITNTSLIISEQYRLFDLQHTISQDNDRIINHRLDRLYIDYTDADKVIRFGRQAISWGNGLIYNPMDFFNPFDPAAIDKEYKTGDDMLYGQKLISNNDDLQAVWVIRRDNNGHVNNKVNSTAIKYHGFTDDNEFDVLIASHYNDTIYALGGIVSLGDAIWRGDITRTNTTTQNVTSMVTSLTYSWLAWGHNFSGVVEYFYNGFGQKKNDYSPAALTNNTELMDRYLRGEIFTLGRNYLATSVLMEVTPLYTFTANFFVNLEDQSLLSQFINTYDFKQNWQLLVSLSLPTGSNGSEFGGVDTGISDKQLSTELRLFAQLARYF